MVKKLRVLVFKDPVYDKQGNLVDIEVDGVHEIFQDPETGELKVKKEKPKPSPDDLIRSGAT